MAETEKFELEISMEATVTVFNKAGEPINWLKPGTKAKHTWYGMPSQKEIELRYADMVDITSATLEDGLFNAHKRVLEAGQ
jgi:hypothetical protein